jgi:hypothetical protein
MIAICNKEFRLITIFYSFFERNEPIDDRENTFEKIIDALSELKPGSQELINFITKPLVLEFYVSLNGVET